MKDVKKFLMVLMAIVFLCGVAYAKDYEVKKKAGDYDVEIKIDKNPPVVGNNNVEIEIKDASGKYVTDAKVKVEYSMPAMPGMPAMDYKTDAKLDGDKYKAVMDISMSGSWNVVVKITRGDKTSKVKFSVDAQ
ncbi:MAG: FixH family protein [Nitrospirae bacterium]|nr:FixH family protein [Nitrospirota bacterium]